MVNQRCGPRRRDDRSEELSTRLRGKVAAEAISDDRPDSETADIAVMVADAMAVCDEVAVHGGKRTLLSFETRPADQIFRTSPKANRKSFGSADARILICVIATAWGGE